MSSAREGPPDLAGANGGEEISVGVVVQYAYVLAGVVLQV